MCQRNNFFLPRKKDYYCAVVTKEGLSESEKKYNFWSNTRMYLQNYEMTDEVFETLKSYDDMIILRGVRNDFFEALIIQFARLKMQILDFKSLFRMLELHFNFDLAKYNNEMPLIGRMAETIKNVEKYNKNYSSLNEVMPTELLCDLFVEIYNTTKDLSNNTKVANQDEKVQEGMNLINTKTENNDNNDKKSLLPKDKFTEIKESKLNLLFNGTSIMHQRVLNIIRQEIDFESLDLNEVFKNPDKRYIQPTMYSFHTVKKSKSHLRKLFNTHLKIYAKLIIESKASKSHFLGDKMNYRAEQTSSNCTVFEFWESLVNELNVEDWNSRKIKLRFFVEEPGKMIGFKVQKDADDGVDVSCYPFSLGVLVLFNLALR